MPAQGQVLCQHRFFGYSLQQLCRAILWVNVQTRKLTHGAYSRHCTMLHRVLCELKDLLHLCIVNKKWSRWPIYKMPGTVFIQCWGYKGKWIAVFALLGYILNKMIQILFFTTNLRCCGFCCFKSPWSLILGFKSIHAMWPVPSRTCGTDIGVGVTEQL